MFKPVLECGKPKKIVLAASNKVFSGHSLIFLATDRVFPALDRFLAPNNDFPGFSVKKPPPPFPASCSMVL